MVEPPRFDARWQDRRRRAAWWRTWRLWIGAGALIAMAAAGWAVLRPLTKAGAWQEVSSDFTICDERAARHCVIDGDTIAIGDRRIRLTGFDAPEMDGACDAETRLALLARRGLREWLDRGPFLLDGGAEPPRDDYGRELRAARRDTVAGEPWLEEWMVESGLARETGWGGAGEDWCEAS